MSEQSHSSEAPDRQGEPSSVEFVPWLYPPELECDMATRDGRTLHLRPIRADDAEKLEAFHSRLSGDSIYRRYFLMHPTLSLAELTHLTQVDYVNRLALVIEDGEQLVAVGRYDRYPLTTRAEVAFVVADDHQHLGLGLELLKRLADAAWVRGITTFSAETMASNRDMMSVFRHSGFPVASTFSDGEISVRFPIEPTEESRERREKYRAGQT